MYVVVIINVYIGDILIVNVVNLVVVILFRFFVVFFSFFKNLILNILLLIYLLNVFIKNVVIVVFVNVFMVCILLGVLYVNNVKIIKIKNKNKVFINKFIIIDFYYDKFIFNFYI